MVVFVIFTMRRLLNDRLRLFDPVLLAAGCNKFAVLHE